MNVRECFGVSQEEKPLDRMTGDGGFSAIFRTICCIGDSLSSGEFETRQEDGTVFYHDFFEYSWGQYLARMTGAKVYNYSRGGMTAKEYCESFAHAMGYWAPAKAAQAYLIALGLNDIWQEMEPEGTFASYYQQIIDRYQKISRGAKFFLLTMPQETSDPEKIRIRKEEHREFLYQIAKQMEHVYVIDLYQYAPVYDPEFKENFYLNGHMNAAGYYLTAKMVASYMDYLIRKNWKDFREVGLIGSGLL